MANKLNKDLISKHVKIDSNNCWNWTRQVSQTGYGHVRYKSKWLRPHRISAHLWLGFDINSKLIVCHKCDNKICCNPDHLFIGTASDNAMDAVKKGRWVNNSGSKHGMSKLNEDDVIFIRELYRAGLTQPTIGYIFGIRYQTVAGITQKRTWRHI